MGALRDELSSRLSSSREAFDKALGVRGAQERVDAITRFCRSLLRASTLCVVDGVVRHFDGRLFVPSPLPEVRTILGDLLIDEGASPSDVRKMGDMPLSVISEKRRDPFDGLAFTNCVFDLRVGVPRPFSSDLVVIHSLPYAFDEKATAHRFFRFLDEVMPDRVEQESMMEFFSLAFVDRREVSVEKMALFVGSGANGKSVVFDVIKATLGDDAVSVLDPSQLTDEKMVPYLKGKRLNFSPDVRKGAAFESALKALASGQKVTARRIFCDAEQVSAPPLAFALNEMPPMRDTTDGFFRRLLIFPFNVSIPEERQDRRLAATIIRDELPGVFNYLLLCRASLRERDYEFRTSPGMRSALDAVRIAADAERSPVRLYLKKRGLSPTPAYAGQVPVPITQGEILLALHGAVSAAAVTRELSRYGVNVRRGRENRVYLVYPIQK